MENNSSTGGCAGHCRGLGSTSIGGAIPNHNLPFGWADGNVTRLVGKVDRTLIDGKVVVPF